ncbi:MAG TPA: Rieske 2Fe-2S domain-containing protein [Candidatus Limnocylindrales bacterium]|nr:Rieske 2Fe-2S domain-containing protein [Candidatus Limnocylindrales bacterium]
MLARALTRLMDAQAGWTKPLGDLAHRFLFWLFSHMTPIRDLLVGRWLGHPLHAVLTDAPIGILFLVLAFDALSMGEAAAWALGVGILTMLGAALAGFADYADTDGKARERATLHSTIMIVALLVFVVSLLVRLGSGTGSGLGVILSWAGFLILSAGAYVGGDVVYVLGNMVSRHAFRGAGTKWLALEPAEVDATGAIPEGKPVKAKLGINQLVLVRQGETILALHDTCAHAGGPLNEGKLVEGQIECPWHYSRYRMTDGAVTRGPSVYDQPAYEVRPREGGGWEARRQTA